MPWLDTDRFENWFVTSLQTSINDTTDSFRINKVPNVLQGRLIIDPFNEEEREVIYFDSHDGNLLTDVLRGDDHTTPTYHLEGTLVVMNVVGADLNDLYAQWAQTQDDLELWKTEQEGELDQWILDAQQEVDDAIEGMETQINGMVTDMEAWVLEHMYPVGSIYFSTVNTNPSTLFGGTWTAWGAGRVPVGVDTGQTEFDTVEETGGAKTHTLTLGQIPNATGTMKAHSSRSSFWTPTGVFGGSSMASTYSPPSASTGGANSVNIWHFSLGGGGGAHNILQPYITCYMWKRTA